MCSFLSFFVTATIFSLTAENIPLTENENLDSLSSRNSASPLSFSGEFDFDAVQNFEKFREIKIAFIVLNQQLINIYESLCAKHPNELEKKQIWRELQINHYEIARLLTKREITLELLNAKTKDVNLDLAMVFFNSATTESRLIKKQTKTKNKKRKAEIL